MVTEIRWSRCAVSLASPVQSAIRRSSSSRKGEAEIVDWAKRLENYWTETRCIRELHILHNLALWRDLRGTARNHRRGLNVRCCNGVDNRHVPCEVSSGLPWNEREAIRSFIVCPQQPFGFFDRWNVGTNQGAVYQIVDRVMACQATWSVLARQRVTPGFYLGISGGGEVSPPESKIPPRKKRNITM